MSARLGAAASILALLAVGGCGGKPSATGGHLQVSVLGSTTNARLDQPFPAGSPDARLLAARNEFESAQVAVQALAGGVEGVDVSLRRPLSGPGGEIPAGNVTIYREAGYAVNPALGTPPSDGEGGVGIWPDALIPKTDYLYGEQRSAFPYDVPDGGRMLAWVDVLVPADAAPGTYRGELAVTDAGGHRTRVPLTLDVINLRLPSTPTLTTALGTSPDAPCLALAGSACRPDSQGWALHALFERAALENRVTIFNPFPTRYGQAPSASDLRARLGSLLSGAGRAPPAGSLPQRLSGARMTSVGAFWQCLRRGSGCLDRWRADVAGLGLAGRFFLFVCDEPNSDASQWAVCDRRSRAAARAWPGATQLITATAQAAAALGASAFANVDILAPIVNQLDDKTGQFSGDQRPVYDSFLSRSAKASQGGAPRLWTYLSCVSDGCAGAPASTYSQGWPSLAIDAPASEARSVGWLAFDYGLSGFLYYDTTRLLTTAWTNQYGSGVNGDGTLFYPGGPSGAGGGPAIGGAHPIPIESMRLKRLRDGVEDYEYLRALAARRGEHAAQAAVAGLLGPRSSAAYSTAVTQVAIDATRCRIAAEIDPAATAFCNRSATLAGAAPITVPPS